LPPNSLASRRDARTACATAVSAVPCATAVSAVANGITVRSRTPLLTEQWHTTWQPFRLLAGPPQGNAGWNTIWNNAKSRTST
jgi:hypothetical protein